MYRLPSSINHVAQFFERLPGIGKKSANRLALYLLRLPEDDLQTLAKHISDMKNSTHRCKICMNLTGETICPICNDSKRNTKVITVVESVLDLLSFETGNIYQGVYHVLHGKIDPLNYVGPQDIAITQLERRIEQKGHAIEEVIVATNADMEGEATAIYIRRKLEEIKRHHNYTFSISRLGYGMPIGGNVEYADYMTLQKAIQNRNTY